MILKLNNLQLHNNQKNKDLLHPVLYLRLIPIIARSQNAFKIKRYLI